MSNVIENLGKLDRKVTLAIPKAEVEKESWNVWFACRRR